MSQKKMKIGIFPSILCLAYVNFLKIVLKIGSVLPTYHVCSI